MSEFVPTRAHVAWFTQNLVGLSTGNAHDALIESVDATDVMYGLEPFPMVAAPVASGDWLGGQRLIMFLGSYAAAVSLIKASLRTQVILATIEIFWRIMGAVAATCGKGRVPFAANSTEAPSSKEKSLSPTFVESELPSPKQVRRRARILQPPGVDLGGGGGDFIR